VLLRPVRPLAFKTLYRL